MSGINKVILVGRLGNDPKVNVFQSGDRAANFSLATSNEWKDKNTGEKKQQTEWHNISVYGPLASICEQYLKKGSQIFVEGRLKTRKYTDKNNIERSITEVVMEKMQMLDSKGDRPGGNDEPNGNLAPQEHAFDDDIPF
jgi:single-strand DNA-binding protein